MGRYIVEGSNDGGNNWDILVDHTAASRRGTQLPRAPIDHVQPAAPGTPSYPISLSDPTEQSNTGPDWKVVAQFPVHFTGAPAALVPTFSALVDVDSGTATFNVRLSATPDVVDGGILAIITKVASGAFELKSVIGAGFPRCPHPR